MSIYVFHDKECVFQLRRDARLIFFEKKLIFFVFCLHILKQCIKFVSEKQTTNINHKNNRLMKLLDFNYIYQTIENDIEQGVQLVEGVKPTVSEMLEYHLTENDENFLQWIFSDYDDYAYLERGDINSLADLTEDELEQVNRLRKYCEE